MMLLTRKYEFSASHRLYNPAFSDAKNCEVFRECNNPNGHGHNYELEVSVAGPMDPESGMIMDIWELDELVKAHWLKKVDHKHLNLDVPEFEGVIPTAENIVVVAWEQLAPQFAGKTAKLARLRLLETKNNFAEYSGPGI